MVCMLTTGGLNGGIRQHVAHLLLNKPGVGTIDPSNACRSRYKIKASAFEQIFREVSSFVHKNCDDPKDQFHNHNVFAVDGSKFSLPASVELKKSFDTNSMNLENRGRHYPLCLVTTFYDVYRKIPVTRTVQPHTGGVERVELIENLNSIPNSSIIISDRGYSGYEVYYLIKDSSNDFVIRTPTSKTAKEVLTFITSDKNEDIVTIKPTEHFIAKWKKGESKIKEPTPVTLRLIRYTPPEGSEEIILATSLLDSKQYPTQEITKLYWDRWQVELFYRDEKCYIEAGKFHSKKEEGIRQELFASVLMATVTKYHLFKEQRKEKRSTVTQFLTAITIITQNLIKIISLSVEEAVKYFKKVMLVVSVGRYHKQQKRRANPRVTKSPPNKWKAKRVQKMKKQE